MSDRDIKAWDERLTTHCARNYDNYFKERIDLSILRTDELKYVAGEFIYVEQVSSRSALAQIKLDKTNAEQLDLVKGARIETIFQKFYISNTAQSGEWIDLLIGINFKYYKPEQSELAEAQPCIQLTHANPNTNVQAAAQICNAALIKADVLNTGVVWIDFGQAAVQNGCIDFDPGEWIELPLSNTNRINANFEIGGEVVWIVPVY